MIHFHGGPITPDTCALKAWKPDPAGSWNVQAKHVRQVEAFHRCVDQVLHLGREEDGIDRKKASKRTLRS